MGKTAAETGLVAKAAQAAKRLETLHAQLAVHRGLTQEAQAREAQTRIELTLALTEALAGRAAAERRAAEQAALRQAEQATLRQALLAARIRSRLGRAWRRLARRPERPVVHDRTEHPLFDAAHYLVQANDLQPEEDGFAHYLREGWRRGLSPHPLFDPAWYIGQLPDSPPDEAPLSHYLRDGWRRGLSPHPLFDAAWYLETNPDVASQGQEPLSHFLVTGAAEGRDPSPWFHMAHYAAARGEGRTQANPLLDYLAGGAWDVAEARPGFPTAAYLADQPAAARAGMTPLEHWARRAAGRL